MRIAIVVQGRFHAFELARSLAARGHEVGVFTNYPRWAAVRFGLDTVQIYSCWLHGIATRVLTLSMFRRWSFEAALHRWFGRWAARALARQQWDVIHVFSGVAEEIIERRPRRGERIILMRGSSHILTQRDLLRQEAARCGAPVEGPSDWMVERELREYAGADQIITLSEFAYQSFVAHGFPRARLKSLLLGADVAAFRPPADRAAARRARIVAGAALRVLFVGTVCYRKGLWDLIQLAKALDPARFELRAIGAVAGVDGAGVAVLSRHARVEPRMPEAALADVYAWGDIFLFPSVEDGFAQVLVQAQAAGLPILATAHCAAPDLLEEGRTGWVVPARATERMRERLQALDLDRAALAEAADRAFASHRPRSWNDVASDFEALVAEG